MILYPKLRDFLTQYPKIKIEIQADNNWVNIVEQGFDMGCRIGDDLAKDMIAIKISEPLKMALVASPDYLKNRTKPEQINDLNDHKLIGLKISSHHGAELSWEFNNNGNAIIYHPSSQLIINNHQRKQAALDGLGITWVGRLEVEKELAEGTLVELLADFAITFKPFYIYYPSRNGHSNVFKLVLEALKY